MLQATPLNPEKPWQKRWVPVLLGLVVLAGIALRLAWPLDIEFKADEAYMFERTQAVGVTESWPALGMPSGVGTRNPGLSIWVFVALARLFGAHDPARATQAVAVVNCLALVLLAWFARRRASSGERTLWLWSTALLAVNPLAVLFHRKLWSLSIFLIFIVALLAAFDRRRTFWGAFFWGLVGAWLGQIHMPGFFFAAGVFLWTLLWDLRGVNWKGWFTGSFTGAVSLVPWLVYLLQQGAASPPRDVPWVSSGFWKLWATDPIGHDLKYSLGADFAAFRSFPELSGQPTHLGAVFHGLLVGVGVLLLVFWLLRWSWLLLTELRVGVRVRSKLQNPSFTFLIVGGGFFGFGVLMMLSRFYLHRHYTVVAYPLQWVWLVSLTLVGARGAWRKLGHGLLAFLLLAQLGASVLFLSYIHDRGGALHGDYGRSYREQLRTGLPGR